MSYEEGEQKFYEDESRRGPIYGHERRFSMPEKVEIEHAETVEVGNPRYLFGGSVEDWFAVYDNLTVKHIKRDNYFGDFGLARGHADSVVRYDSDDDALFRAGVIDKGGLIPDQWRGTLRRPTVGRTFPVPRVESVGKLPSWVDLDQVLISDNVGRTGDSQRAAGMIARKPATGEWYIIQFFFLPPTGFIDNDVMDIKTVRLPDWLTGKDASELIFDGGHIGSLTDATTLRFTLNNIPNFDLVVNTEVTVEKIISTAGGIGFTGGGDDRLSISLAFMANGILRELTINSWFDEIAESWDGTTIVLSPTDAFFDDDAFPDKLVETTSTAYSSIPYSSNPKPPRIQSSFWVFDDIFKWGGRIWTHIDGAIPDVVASTGDGFIGLTDERNLAFWYDAERNLVEIQRGILGGVRHAVVSPDGNTWEPSESWPLKNQYPFWEIWRGGKKIPLYTPKGELKGIWGLIQGAAMAVYGFVTWDDLGLTFHDINFMVDPHLLPGGEICAPGDFGGFVYLNPHTMEMTRQTFQDNTLLLNDHQINPVDDFGRVLASPPCTETNYGVIECRDFTTSTFRGRTAFYEYGSHWGVLEGGNMGHTQGIYHDGLYYMVQGVAEGYEIVKGGREGYFDEPEDLFRTIKDFGWDSDFSGMHVGVYNKYWEIDSMIDLYPIIDNYAAQEWGRGYLGSRDFLYGVDRFRPMYHPEKMMVEIGVQVSSSQFSHSPIGDDHDHIINCLLWLNLDELKIEGHFFGARKTPSSRWIGPVPNFDDPPEFYDFVADTGNASGAMFAPWDTSKILMATDFGLGVILVPDEKQSLLSEEWPSIEGMYLIGSGGGEHVATQTDPFIGVCPWPDFIEKDYFFANVYGAVGKFHRDQGIVGVSTAFTGAYFFDESSPMPIPNPNRRGNTSVVESVRVDFDKSMDLPIDYWNW